MKIRVFVCSFPWHFIAKNGQKWPLNGHFDEGWNVGRSNTTPINSFFWWFLWSEIQVIQIWYWIFYFWNAMGSHVMSVGKINISLRFRPSVIIGSCIRPQPDCTLLVLVNFCLNMEFCLQKLLICKQKLLGLSLHECAWYKISAVCLVSIVRDRSKTKLNMFSMKARVKPFKIKIKNDSAKK